MQTCKLQPPVNILCYTCLPAPTVLILGPNGHGPNYFCLIPQQEIQVSDEPELIMSPLCQTLNIEGHSLQIEIYRGGTSKWILEVVDVSGTSTVWDEQFETDQLAFEELSRTIREEGVRSIVGAP